MAEEELVEKEPMSRSHRGSYSELLAQAALLADGYVVSQPITVEPFDLTIKKPGDKRAYYVQVKTIYVRDSERYNGEWFVVKGVRNNGQIYSKEEVDYFAAVNGEDVYLFENTEQSEYWTRRDPSEMKWTKLGGS